MSASKKSGSSMLKTYKTLRNASNVRRGLLALWAILTLLVIGLDIFFAVLLGKGGLLALTGQTDYILRQIMMVSLIFASKLVLVWISSWVRGGYREKVFVNLRIHTINSIIDAQWGWMERQSPGDILERCGTNLYNAVEILSGELFDVVVNAVQTVISGFFMFLINWQIALSFFIAYPFIILIQLWSSRPTEKNFRKTFQHRGEYMGIVQSDIENTELIQAYRYVPHACEKASKYYDSYAATYKKTWRIGLPGMAAGMVFSLLPIALFSWTGYHQVQNGTLTLDSLLTLMIVIMPLFNILQQFFDQILHIRERKASSERLIEIWEARPEKIDRTLSTRSHMSKDHSLPILSFEHVSFSYDGIHNALNDISFSIYPNEHIAIIGDNGSGKSTLMKLILRLYEPTRGSIYVYGHNCQQWSLKDYRALFAYVPQENFLFSGSIADNLWHGDLNATEGEMIEACELTQIWGKIRSLPDQLGAAVGEGGKDLSGGERQRLTIARAYLHNADIYLLDEVTSALDKKTAFYILNNIMERAGNKTVITITHTTDSYEIFDRVLVLKEGRIIEQGDPKELMCNENS